uniref:F-box domain-containing protein n=1 Tax=Oryza brachyantha TaxID=4533 RepID=J3MBM7_ORYBR
MENQRKSGGYDEPLTKRRRCTPAGGTVADIPDDVAEQILLRLPVKSILRFRSVCKSWRAMVADPALRAPPFHGGATPAAVHARRATASEAGNSSQTTFVCNPATRELVVLPANTPDLHGIHGPVSRN